MAPYLLCFQDTYYIPYHHDRKTGLKIPAKGKLISQYHNIPKNIKAAGLVKGGKENQTEPEVDGKVSFYLVSEHKGERTEKYQEILSFEKKCWDYHRYVQKLRGIRLAV